MWEPALKTVIAEGRVIAEALHVFLSAAAILCLITWALTRLQYTTQLKNLESGKASLQEVIRLKDQQIDDYKARLQKASPDDAEKKIGGTMPAIRALAPRNITPDQRERMDIALRGTSGSILISHDVGTPDASRFADQIGDPFSVAGWQIVRAVAMGFESFLPSTGVGVIVASGFPTDAEKAALRALDSGRIEYDIIQRPPDRQGRADVEIIITDRED